MNWFRLYPPDALPKDPTPDARRRLVRRVHERAQNRGGRVCVVRVSQSNKRTELVKAVLVYCAGRLVEGDIQALLDLGLEDADLNELAAVRLVDLAQADRFVGCLRVDVTLDVPAFRAMLRHAEASCAPRSASAR